MIVRALCLVLLVLIMHVHRACADSALSWIDCSQAGGAGAQFFACDTSDGADELVLTVTPNTSLGVVTRVRFSILIVSGADTLPDWWRIGLGGRRPVQILTSFDNPPFEDGICRDPWGVDFSGAAIFEPNPDGCTACGRIKVEIEGSTVEPLLKGERYYICRMRLTHRHSTGPNAVTGCATPVCIRLEHLYFVLADGSVSTSYGSYSVGWQTPWCY